MPDNFGVKWRKRWKLTQEQAAKHLGVDKRTIRNYDKRLPLIAELAMRYLNMIWKRN